MADIFDDLRRTFRQGNIVVRLIYINVGAFVLSTLLSVLLGLFGIDTTEFLRCFYLPADLGVLSLTCLCMQGYGIFWVICFGCIGLGGCSFISSLQSIFVDFMS